MIAKIVDVFEKDCHLIVLVEHYHADGSFWFREDYRWQGREGLKQKRATNDQGEALMDDGQVAPTHNVEGDQLHYLPEGREWARLPAPHIVDDSILSVIRSIHAQRLVWGWPQGAIDQVSSIPDSKISQRDRDGCPVLIAKFAALVGYEI